MKNLIRSAIIFSFALVVSACSTESSPDSRTADLETDADKSQEARGVKQTPMPKSPQLKDRL